MTKPKLYVIYYSTWGHVRKLAETIKEEAAKNDEVDVSIWQIAETLSQEVLTKMHAVPKADHSIITPLEIANADAFIFGEYSKRVAVFACTPTLYGNMPAQFKTFWDATGQLWAKGQLYGKLGAIFFCTAHSGQEPTALDFLTTLVQHGILYVPLGYFDVPRITDMAEIGDSAYGAGTIRNGSRQISVSCPAQVHDRKFNTTGLLKLVVTINLQDKEFDIARHQGREFAKTVVQYHHGRSTGN
ncbi:NAD(P)H:quinone oxidoreductase, type IV [Endogone sp. FLAS-F59071]|nr:NAD(P)H:quinone oxidoreductase, type IV [Endogone sp. FLAS-F59071]|eukprot:RUS15855.1 NAD(P)H:quinone oxidoreductase, type IV [Endogone sp. FLAS-F59071]